MEKIKGNNSSYILEMLKALIIALIISLVLVLATALITKVFNLPDLSFITQLIKGLSILISLLIAFKLPKNAWIRGLVFGFLYIALTYVVFSLLDGGFNFSISLLNDFALGGVSGLISAIISVNLIKRS